MYVYWMDAGEKTCPLTYTPCKGPYCQQWRWTGKFNGKDVVINPNSSFEKTVKIEARMVGYCGAAIKPEVEVMEPVHSGGPFTPFNP